MKPIALFHHSRLSGGDPPIAFDWAVSILAEQIIAMRDSGLSAAASELYFGVNGGEQDAMAVQSLVPDGAQVIQHPDEARGELPTLNLMWQWARSHPGWLVLYLHTKAATHAGDMMYRSWMRCMLRAVVWNWEACVADLGRGIDAVGCHWLTKERYQNIGAPFFGGNFFFVTSDFWATLPEPPKNARTRAEFYTAEVIISSGQRLPQIRDYHSAWPGASCHQRMSAQ